MVKIVKYTSDLGADAGAECGEELPGCEKRAFLHVCFEDGSGVYTCKKCFNKRINEGEWITDSTQTLLAS